MSLVTRSLPNRPPALSRHHEKTGDRDQACRCDDDKDQSYASRPECEGRQETPCRPVLRFSQGLTARAA